MPSVEDLAAERFWPTSPPVNNLTARRAEIADIQYRDRDIVRCYVKRLGGRVCDLPGPLLDLITTIVKEPVCRE